MSNVLRVLQGVLLLALAVGIFFLALLAALGDAATVSQANPCQPPDGWTAAAVPAGSSLSELAEANSVSVARLLHANCLSSEPDTLPRQLNLPDSADPR